MRPMLPWRQIRPRLPRLLFGLVLFGVGIALTVVAGLGLAPWTVFHEGISIHTGIPIGTVGIITGFLVLFSWIPLGERPGLATVLNVVVIGVVIDLTLWVLPDNLGPWWADWASLLGGVVLVAMGTGFYIGVDLGPGPRDGLMTGIARRGYPVGLVRGVLEVTVLAAGWLLGGTVGVGTVVFAFFIGPVVHVFMERLKLPVEL